MIRKLAIAAAFLVAATAQAAAACQLTPARVLAGAPFFGSYMEPTDDGPSGAATFVHPDDPRIIVSFTIASAEPVGPVSRGEYVKKIESYASFTVQRVRQQDRFADSSVYPLDPVAWRTIEAAEVEGVGPALVGHMEIRLTPQCVVVADFISPDSVTLRSRWQKVIAEVAAIRDIPGLAVPEQWEREDTTPTGLAAIAGGFVPPVGVIGVLYLLLGQIRRFDPPSIYTRSVLGCCAVVALGSIAYHYGYYVEAWSEGRYVDNLLLLAFTGLACAAGAALEQRATTLGLISACVTGIALSVASALGWTPDEVTSFASGAALILMGVFGFFAWSEASGRPAR